MILLLKTSFKLLSISIVFLCAFLIVLLEFHSSSGKTEKPLSKSQIDFIKKEMKKCGFGIWGVGAARPDSITFVADPLKEKGIVAKFTIHNGDHVHGGTRSEINKNFLDPEGSEVWYSWSVLIPEDYNDSFLLNPDTNKSHWQKIGQWHDQPDQAKGEVNPGRSPTISINYLHFSKKDPAYETVTSTKAIQALVGYTEDWDNQSVLALGYGAPSKTVALYPINKGQWYKLLFHIKWSTQDDGFIEVFIDDKSLTRGKITGENMHNDLPHYLKIGIYRDPEITTSNSVYFTCPLHGQNRNEVEKKTSTKDPND